MLTLGEFKDNASIDLDNVALGDPALLLPLFFPQQKKDLYDVGVILHYVDVESDCIKNIKISSKVIFIDIRAAPDKIIEMVCSCSCILSSSLHGLIVADAYGIPNQRIILSDMIIGGDYKFDDYNSVFNDKPLPAIDLRKETVDDSAIDRIFRHGFNRGKQILNIQNVLVNSFPKKWAFDLDLSYIQNLRLCQAILEIDKNVLVPLREYEKFLYLSEYFDFNIGFYNDCSEIYKRDISFNHEKASFIIEGREHPLVFPKELIKLCKSKWNHKKGVIFTGLKTDKRLAALTMWLESSGCITELNKVNELIIDDIKIVFTDKGRRFPVKSFDKDYYNQLCDAEFSLCPDGDFIWTYRFFESIMCGAIPIVENVCDQYSGFKFYKFDNQRQDLVYYPEWASHNFDMLIDRHTLTGGEISK